MTCNPNKIEKIPTRTQYRANQIRFPFFTRLIIHLHAKYPEIKAVINPIKITKKDVPSVDKSPDFISTRFAPIIGTKTIRNENFAISDFLFPIIIPVAIVAPDLEIARKNSNSLGNTNYK